MLDGLDSLDLTTLNLGLNGQIGESGLEALIAVPGFEPLSVGLQDLTRDPAMRERLKARFGAALGYL